MHRELIDSLGGSASVAGLVREMGVPVTTAQVVMWAKREVSWRYRAVVADIARQRGVELPQRFLGYDESARV